MSTPPPIPEGKSEDKSSDTIQEERPQDGRSHLNSYLFPSPPHKRRREAHSQHVLSRKESRTVDLKTLFKMPVSITTRKLTAWQNDLSDEIKVSMLNEVVEDYAAEAVRALSDLSCPKHPQQMSYITITADRNRTMIIEKKFCCPEFDQKVSLKLLRG